MGMDRIALREKNLIPPEAMPFRTGLDYTYDSGDFPKNMALALKAADWAGFEARRAEAKARGKLRGIGIANAIESAGGPHRGPMEEAAEIRFDSGGSMTLLMGSHNHGQGLRPAQLLRRHGRQPRVKGAGHPRVGHVEDPGDPLIGALPSEPGGPGLVVRRDPLRGEQTVVDGDVRERASEQGGRAADGGGAALALAVNGDRDRRGDVVRQLR
jgi:hypothetical protein